MSFKNISNYKRGDLSNFEKVSESPSETDSSFYKSVESIFRQYVIEGKVPVPDYARQLDSEDCDDYDDLDFDSVIPNSKDLADVSEAVDFLESVSTNSKKSKNKSLETLDDDGVRIKHADAVETSVSLPDTDKKE